MTDSEETKAPQVRLEHVNVTVTDAERTAAMLCDIFGWHVRWKGDSMKGGASMHIGTEDQYVAVYALPEVEASNESSYTHAGGLNHIAFVVDDLDAIEARVRAAGFEPGSFADYEPGRRFYFWDHDNIEYEVLSYA